MGQINTNNYPTVDSLADADLLIVENATHGTGTTTPKQLRENAIGTDPLQTTAQTVTGAINELKTAIDAGSDVKCYDIDTISSGYFGEFDGKAKLLLLHLTADGTADATDGYTMLLSYTRPVARLLYGQLVDSEGVAYKHDVYAENTIICEVTNSGEGTEADPRQVVILGITNAAFTLTPTAVVSDRDIIDGQGNTLSVLAEALTKTASGNPVVISDCAGGKARSLKTTIEAIQDLHGYDKPWAGGAGKNKLHITATTQTKNGYTFTFASDGTFSISGTPTSTVTEITLATQTIPSGDCKLNGCGFANDNCRLQLFKGSTLVGSQYNNNDLSFTSDGGEYKLTIVVINAAGTLNNQIVKPMIRLSTESDASFAPYSNICPISGRTEARVDTENEDSSESAYAVIQLGTTVYGADINWDTGVMTVTHACDTFDGSVDENWGFTDAQHIAYIELSNVKNPQTPISNLYLGVSTRQWGTLNDNEFAFSPTTGSENYFNLKDNAVDNITAWKAKLASNPLQVCYELATPTTIQLTPTQLQMLKGYNRLTIEDGSIELGYIAKIS